MLSKDCPLRLLATRLAFQIHASDASSGLSCLLTRCQMRKAHIIWATSALKTTRPIARHIAGRVLALPFAGYRAKRWTRRYGAVVRMNRVLRPIFRLRVSIPSKWAPFILTSECVYYSIRNGGRLEANCGKIDVMLRHITRCVNITD